MAVLTEERYALCPLWRQLLRFWPHNLTAIDRNHPETLQDFPALDAIWLKAEPHESGDRLLSRVDDLARRDVRCHLIVCLDEADPGLMQELLERGVDEILFQTGIMAEPQVLQKTIKVLDARRGHIDQLKAHILRHQKALQAKTDVLTWLSHEIRTPMNGVLGMLELLPRQGLTPEQHDMLDVMERSGHRLIDLVSDVLDVSRMEAGKMKCTSRDFDLRRLIQDCLQLHSHDAHTRGLSVIHCIEPDVPKLLRGDEGKLCQILNNLISNAVKYTSAGHVMVKVRVEAREGETCRLQLAVEDTGYGIVPEEQHKVFAPFEQTDSAHLNRRPSSGLGLSLTKNLVELLGGDIALQSRRGSGSTFTCRLPFEVPEGTPALSRNAVPAHRVRVDRVRRRRSSQPGSRGSYVLRHPGSNRPALSVSGENAEGRMPTFEGIRILVVDDEQVNLKVADRQLKKLNAITTLASSGAEALEWLDKKHFDLIFVDCQMPHMNGFELLSIMRGMPQLIPGTPIIALTALSHDEDREKIMQHGFADFLAKPARVEDIQQLLGRWLALNG